MIGLQLRMGIIQVPCVFDDCAAKLSHSDITTVMKGLPVQAEGR